MRHPDLLLANRSPGNGRAGKSHLERSQPLGSVHLLVVTSRSRFGAMPEEIRAVIEATHDEPTLLTWLTLAGTRGVDEITVAIRASHPN